MGRKAQGRKPSALGKALVKAKANSAKARRHNQQFAGVHVMDAETADGVTNSGVISSVVDRNELDEFLCNALLKEQQFAAERGNMVVLGTKTIQKDNLQASAEAAAARAARLKEEEEFGVSEEITADVVEGLRIPRRPQWNKTMTADELDRLEKDAFLEWRRTLAILEEKTTGSRMITPFEKNLEVWRQLWRVIERSDVVAQIVDARNPLLYRSIDLEAYVKEASAHKRCILIVNKADFLSIQARAMWAAYFHAHRIPFVFFSAQTEQDAIDAELDAARAEAKAAQSKHKAGFGAGRRYGKTESEEDSEADEDQKADPNTKPKADDRKQRKPAPKPAAGDDDDDDDGDDNAFAGLNADGEDDDGDDDDDDGGAKDAKAAPAAAKPAAKAAAAPAASAAPMASSGAAAAAAAAAGASAGSSSAAAAAAAVAADSKAAPSSSSAAAAAGAAAAAAPAAPGAAAAAAAASGPKPKVSVAASQVTAQAITPQGLGADAPAPLSAAELFALTHVMNRHELIAHCLAVARSIAPEHRADPKSVFVGMVGYPNVGKSSTINVLCGKKRVAVSATPGRTKHFQTIVLSSDATLCDCPGLVFPTFMASRSNLVINGVLPIDQMHDYLGPIQQICSRIGTRQWLEAYALVFPNWQTVNAEELLLAHAKMRGWIKDHGRPDGSRSARIILKDFVTGKLLYCSPPPHLTADQRHIFHTSYTRVHIASRKNKVPSLDEDGNAPITAAQQGAAAPGSAVGAQAAAAAGPRGQLVVVGGGSAANAMAAAGAAGAAGAAARDPNAPPVIADAERGLLEEMYHVSKPLTKTQYRKAKKDKSVLQVMDQNSGKQKGKKGKKLRKQTIALGDVEAHTNGKNPIANFRRFDMLSLSSQPAAAPLGAVPAASAGAAGKGAAGVRRRPGDVKSAGAGTPALADMLPLDDDE